MKTIKFIIFLFIQTSLMFGLTYEPIEMKSGGMLGAGNLRFLFDWGYLENNSSDSSTFGFGIDFGLNEKIDLQNRIKYLNYNSGSYDWHNWEEILKWKLGQVSAGPAYAIGTGLAIPLHKNESLGLIAGLYISSAIKDIDFDFNAELSPFYLTYADLGKNPVTGIVRKERPSSIFNINLRLGYKIMPILKLAGGFELNQFFSGKIKYEKDNEEIETKEIPGGSAWNLILGARLKPKGYPILFDASISLGLSEKSPYDWRIKFGTQLQPQSPNAEW